MSSLGDSDLEPKPAAKRLAVLLAVLMVGWVAALLLLSSGRGRRPQRAYQRLPVYEGAYDLHFDRAEVADWDQVKYRVEMSYPSTAVYHFYRQILESEGWERQPPDRVPEWRLVGKGGKVRATFYADWASADQLRLIELTLTTVPDEEPPAMQVVVQRSRAILPEIQPKTRR